MSEAKISVIVPCYNVSKFVSRCLDSLIGQTISEIEIICVDDKSTDNTLEILNNYAAKDCRVSVVAFDKNMGVAIARNVGLEKANGKFIGFVDPDDYVDTDFYETLYKTATETGAPVVKAAVRTTNSVDKKSCISDLNKQLQENLLYWNHQFWSALYERDFLLKNNITFPDEVITGQDSVFLTHILLCTDNIVLIDNTYYHYFMYNEGSLDSLKLSRRKSQSKLDMVANKLRLIEGLCADKARQRDFIKTQVIPTICYEIKKVFEYKKHKKQLFQILSEYNKNPEYQQTIKDQLGKSRYKMLAKHKMFKHNSEKMFYKERLPDGRRNIYILGKRVWSYKRWC